ncbi:MAG TPA: class I SAM-dependent methyltransferase [Thermoanaerobaculia bacterium]|nr:class I SAM-dependent methyltransferase [Thermoanaerobaculia bacterium]
MKAPLHVYLGSDMAPLLNGLTVAPTLHCLLRHGVFECFGNVAAPRARTFSDLADELGVQDTTRGNLLGALRTLGFHGWIRIDGPDDRAWLALTDAGWVAVDLAVQNAAALTAAVAFIRHARDLHALLRDRLADGGPLTEYEALIASSAEGWGLRGAQGPTGERVQRHLCRHLDGLLLCPTLVALGMPVFEERDGSIEEAAPGIFDRFRNGLFDLERDGSDLNRPFVTAAFRLLEQQGVLESRGAGQARLTEHGIALTTEIASYGVTVSYLRSYGQLDDLLFGTARPFGDSQDAHVYRLMNIWGSGGSSIIGELRREICEQVLRDVFDQRPLSGQPAGIADMGCGSGMPLREMAEYVIHQTARGRALRELPLVLLGIDSSSTALGRARRTLEPLGSIDGVTVVLVGGDVARPELLDEELAALGASVQGPADGERRPLRVRDFLHIQMFLLHDRELAGEERETARARLQEAITGANPWALADALRRCGVPSVPAERDELGRLVEAQLTTPHASGGRLTPAWVSVADLVQLVRRWAAHAPYGLVLLEPHVPRLSELQTAVPCGAQDGMRVEVDPSAAVWGVHYISSQFPLPYREHGLAMTLAGMSAITERATGTESMSIGWWVPSEDVYFDPRRAEA